MANHGAFKEVAEDRDFAKLTRENERLLREKKGTKASLEDVEWAVQIEEGDLLTAEELLEFEDRQSFE
jgi:hypothetical protein